MKKYDFKKAKIIVEHFSKHNDLEVSIGFYEDWFWTADILFSAGEFKIDLSTVNGIVGLSQSEFATPVIILEFDGSKRCFEISQEAGSICQKNWDHSHGEMSRDCQGNITQLPIEQFDDKIMLNLQ